MVLIKFLERRDPARLLGFGLFVMCAGFGLLPLGRGLAFAALAVTVWTFGEMLCLPFSNVLVAQRAAAGRTGQAMGMYSALFSVAAVPAPVIGLPVLERYGGEVLWTACGLIGIPLWIGMAMLARGMRQSRSQEEGSDRRSTALAAIERSFEEVRVRVGKPNRTREDLHER